MNDKVSIPMNVFYNKPLVAIGFPIIFPNGVKFVHLNFLCTDCKKPIDKDFLRGHIKAIVIKNETYRSDQTVCGYGLNVMGYCKTCNTLTPFNYAITDTRHIISYENGNLSVWGANDSLWDRFKKWWNNEEV